ncbi:hypothetical protein QTO30_21085 [Yoonia sp. GPGPB17]|uniref:hypothetical protein n=1 Tax=Yoonia sp. GPGPB17 TaxID=3026147 RepID=UPI0030C00F94
MGHSQTPRVTSYPVGLRHGNTKHRRHYSKRVDEVRLSTAYLSKPNSNETVKIGSLIQTDHGALLLWLFSYPIKGQVIEIELSNDFGTETNEVGVLIDHESCQPEFSVGEVKIANNRAQMTMFGIPVFPATFLLKPPKEPFCASLAASVSQNSEQISA